MLPVPKSQSDLRGRRGGRGVQCLRAEQRPGTMELTEMAESDQSIHLERGQLETSEKLRSDHITDITKM